MWDFFRECSAYSISYIFVLIQKKSVAGTKFLNKEHTEISEKRIGNGTGILPEISGRTNEKRV